MQRIEVQHHTSEQVKSYVDEAYLIVTELGLPDQFAELAFVEAVRLLSSKTVQATVTPSGVMIPHGG